VPGMTSSIHPHDPDWTGDVMFHAGFLRQEPGDVRQLIERRPDGDLWIDITPRSAHDVLETTRMNATNASAILLCIGAIVVMVMMRWQPATSIVLILLARIALLPLRFIDD